MRGHRVLTESDASGQAVTYRYDAFGQMLTRTNANDETTTYAYGGSAPAGYLASITSPPFNGVSAITSFGYDSCNRVRTVTNQADQYTVTMDYDNLDRKVMVTYPDGTYEQFQYTDNVTGKMSLDLTGSRDRAGRWTLSSLRRQSKTGFNHRSIWPHDALRLVYLRCSE